MTHFHRLILPLQLVLLTALLSSLACRKEQVTLLTETEALEIIETAMIRQCSGWSLSVSQCAQAVNASSLICGASYDTLWQAGQTDSLYSYQQTNALHWDIKCAPQTPHNAEIMANGTGAFSAPHWNGENQTRTNLVFEGLEPGSMLYTVHGNFIRDGMLTGDQRTAYPDFTCLTFMSTTNLTIRKSDLQITGGVGAASVSAVIGGYSTTLKGSVVFNGDGTATASFNGMSRTFSL